MTKNVRLSWIAEAEARRFEDSARAQRGLSEPAIGMVPAPSEAPPRHWVRRLVARLAPGPKAARPWTWRGEGSC